jgi:hypothetical protein
VNAAIRLEGIATPPDLRMYTSMTCEQLLAAFVQIARDGKDKGDGFFGDGMKGRWMRIWR